MATLSQPTATQTNLPATQAVAAPDGISAPLNPFPAPDYMQVPSSINMGAVFTALFFLIFIAWLIYSLIACYHLLRYGHKSWLTIPAIALHLFVSGFCIIFAISGLQ